MDGLPDDHGGNRAELFAEQGWGKLAEGDFESALQCADAALGSAPSWADALSLRAAALEGLGRLDEAAIAHESILRHAPNDTGVIADAAQFFLDQAEEAPAPEEWLTRATELARTGIALADSVADETLDELASVEAQALTALGRTQEALSRIDEGLGRSRSNCTPLLCERGVVLFELCRFDEARRQLEAVVREDPSPPRANYTLALIAERLGQTEEADLRFDLAEKQEPDSFPRGVHLSGKAFDAAVEDALRELPPEVRARMSNVAVLVEDFPSEDDLLAVTPPLSPSTLGMFRGTPVGEGDSTDPWSLFPSTIVLYQRNLERFATDRDDLVKQIRITVLHEVGHFVGLGEQWLREHGLD